MATSGTAAMVLGADEGEVLWGMGERLVRRVTDQQTGGAFMLAEQTVEPGGGPPPHVHSREDEAFYVLEGEVDFLVEDRIIPASAGTFVWAPRGKVHQYRPRGGPARFLLLAAPGAFESLLLRYCTPARPGELTPPTLDPDLPRRVVEMATRDFGIRVVPDADATRRAPVPQRRGVWVLGVHVTFLACGAETSGQLCIVEVTAPPQAGPPPHFHQQQSETFHVLSGQFELQLGDRTMRLGPGATAYIPPRTLHAFHNCGTETGRLLSIHHTAGMEAFFEECGVEGPVDAPPRLDPVDPQAVVALLHRHGMGLPGEQ